MKKLFHLVFFMMEIMFFWFNVHRMMVMVERCYFFDCWKNGFRLMLNLYLFHVIVVKSALNPDLSVIVCSLVVNYCT